jgi:hypothetical protein
MWFVWFWPLFVDALIFYVVAMLVSFGDVRCCCNEMWKARINCFFLVQSLILELVYTNA